MDSVHAERQQLASHFTVHRAMLMIAAQVRGSSFRSSWCSLILASRFVSEDRFRLFGSLDRCIHPSLCGTAGSTATSAQTCRRLRRRRTAEAGKLFSIIK